ncbi:MAG: xylulokinase [Oscillospiraceae bacterium]|nr:xylulokinase [Oscillospiraceae bacterium]
MLYIGIDLGTTSVKMLLVDEGGDIRRTVSVDYPLDINDAGWSQQNPGDWWDGVVTGMGELMRGVSDAAEVRALAFSGQMHGLVILDADDEVIRPAILWNDQRTAKQCDALNNGIGRRTLIDNTANVALTGFTAPKILWVNENEPENFARINKIMLPKDYIAYRLTGIFATDYSDAAGTLLLDVKRREWSPFMLEAAGVKREQLPALYNSFDCVGTLTEGAARALGLSTETKVVIGGGDQAVGAVGAGTVIGGMCSVSLGTAGVVLVAGDVFQVDYSDAALHSFCHANGQYYMMGVTLAAGGSNEWWVEGILGTDDYGAEQEDISISTLGDNKVFYLPYITGERTPHNDPYARGAFVGMSSATRRADMTQAVMEGVAFSLRDSLEVARRLGADVKTARIISGGAKSALWCQIIANVFGVDVERINSQEGSALGAAILAMVGDGAFATVEEACGTLISVTDRFAPDPAAVAKYNDKYKVFRQLYQDLKSTYKMMKAD